MGSYILNNIATCQFGELSRNSRNYLICTALSIHGGSWARRAARCTKKEGEDGEKEALPTRRLTHVLPIISCF